MHLIFILFIGNSSALVGSTFGGTWKDPGGVFFQFAVKRALRQDQIVHLEPGGETSIYCLLQQIVGRFAGQEKRSQ